MSAEEGAGQITDPNDATNQILSGLVASLGDAHEQFGDGMIGIKLLSECVKRGISLGDSDVVGKLLLTVFASKGQHNDQWVPSKERAEVKRALTSQLNLQVLAFLTRKVESLLRKQAASITDRVGILQAQAAGAEEYAASLSELLLSRLMESADTLMLTVSKYIVSNFSKFALFAWQRYLLTARGLHTSDLHISEAEYTGAFLGVSAHIAEAVRAFVANDLVEVFVPAIHANVYSQFGFTDALPVPEAFTLPIPPPGASIAPQPSVKVYTKAAPPRSPASCGGVEWGGSLPSQPSPALAAGQPPAPAATSQASASAADHFADAFERMRASGAQTHFRSRFRNYLQNGAIEAGDVEQRTTMVEAAMSGKPRDESGPASDVVHHSGSTSAGAATANVSATVTGKKRGRPPKNKSVAPAAASGKGVAPALSTVIDLVDEDENDQDGTGDGHGGRADSGSESGASRAKGASRAGRGPGRPPAASKRAVQGPKPKAAKAQRTKFSAAVADADSDGEAEETFDDLDARSGAESDAEPGSDESIHSDESKPAFITWRHLVHHDLIQPGKAVLTVTLSKDEKRTASIVDDGEVRRRKGPGPASRILTIVDNSTKKRFEDEVDWLHTITDHKTGKPVTAAKLKYTDPDSGKSWAWGKLKERADGMARGRLLF